MTYVRFSCIRQGPREEPRGGMGRLEVGVKQGKWVTEGGELGNQLVAGLGFRDCSSYRELARIGRSQVSRVAPLLGGWGVMSELGSKHRAGNRARGPAWQGGN